MGYVETKLLRAPDIHNLTDYQRVYLYWKSACGIDQEDNGRLTHRVGEEIIELCDARDAYKRHPTSRNHRRIAGEAADVFNFAMSVLTVEDKDLDIVFSNGKPVKTFEALEEEAGLLVHQDNPNIIIDSLGEHHLMLLEAVAIHNHSAIVEEAAQLVLRSSAVIHKLGYPVCKIIGAKLLRNFLKYNPEKMRGLVTSGLTIEEAQKVCQADWKKEGHELDDLFILAQLSNSEQFTWAVEIVYNSHGITSQQPSLRS